MIKEKKIMYRKRARELTRVLMKKVFVGYSNIPLKFANVKTYFNFVCDIYFTPIKVNDLIKNLTTILG